MGSFDINPYAFGDSSALAFRKVATGTQLLMLKFLFLRIKSINVQVIVFGISGARREVASIPPRNQINLVMLLSR